MSKPPLSRAEIERRLTAAAAMPGASLREIEALGMCRWLAERAEAEKDPDCGDCPGTESICECAPEDPAVCTPKRLRDQLSAWLNREPLETDAACGGEG